jgi:hypothetical protein
LIFSVSKITWSGGGARKSGSDRPTRRVNIDHLLSSTKSYR